MQEGTSPEFRRVWLRPCWPNCTVDRLARTGWSPTHFRRDYTTSKGFARLIYADADSTFVLEEVDWPDDPASYSGGAADVRRGCAAAAGFALRWINLSQHLSLCFVLSESSPIQGRCGYYLLTDSWWLMLGSLCAWEDTRGVDRTDTNRIFLVKSMYTGLGNLRYLLVS